MIDSWLEQRNFTYYAIDALSDHPVVQDIKRELTALQAHEPDLTGPLSCTPASLPVVNFN